jgi:hypothetical protein
VVVHLESLRLVVQQLRVPGKVVGAWGALARGKPSVGVRVVEVAAVVSNLVPRLP